MYRRAVTTVAVLVAVFSLFVPAADASPGHARLTAYYSGIGHAGARIARALGAGRVLTVDGTFDGPWPDSVPCTPSSSAANFAGRPIDRLAGWSLGRLGPIYALHYLREHDQRRARNISYILLFDPGSPDDFSGSCDIDPRVAASATLAWWLGIPGTDHRLVVIAGNLTRTADDQSIRAAYFPDIVAGGDQIRHRVLVCDYGLDHDATYFRNAGLMVSRRISTLPTSCPDRGGELVRGWNP